MQAALGELSARGVLVVASAGNGGSDTHSTLCVLIGSTCLVSRRRWTSCLPGGSWWWPRQATTAPTQTPRPTTRPRCRMTSSSPSAPPRARMRSGGGPPASTCAAVFSGTLMMLHGDTKQLHPGH